MSNEQIQEWVEQYCLGLLSEQENQKFEDTFNESKELQKLVSEHKAFMRLLSLRTSKEFVTNQLNIIKQEQHNKFSKLSNNLQLHINKYWRTASIAAGVAFIASTITFMIARSSFDQKLNSTYTQLNRKINNEVNTIKRDQKALENKNGKAMPEQPKGSGVSAGTCFAINNKGYAVTNAHVINGSKSIYIFTSDNIGHRADVVSIDNNLDIALLKISEEDFKFSKANIPYSLNTSSSKLAQDVFTLGFPKNSVVYNKGYISSEYGFNDDTSRYQMELPSSPGVSGSPVFNDQGNIVAIINSKESMSGGVTYALKSKKLNNFIKSLDTINANGSNALTGLTRAEQIKRLQEFVLVVKTY